MADPEAEYLSLPASTLKRNHGFSLDIGCSLTKLAYTRPAPEPDTVRVCFRSWPRARYQDALRLIQDECGETLQVCGAGEGGGNNPPAIVTCGQGCYKYMDDITERLGVKTVYKFEFECFVEAFSLLVETQPTETLCLPPSTKVQRHMEKVLVKYRGAVDNTRVDTKDTAKSSEISEDAQSKTAAESVKIDPSNIDSTQKPTLLFMLGSANSVIKISADGSHIQEDFTPFGGITLAGLGKLLTGAETFDELVALASRGNHANVDTMTEDLRTERQDGFFSVLPDGLVALAMGKAATAPSGTLSREDVAASLMTSYCSSVAHLLHLQVLLHRPPHVYFVGSTASNHSVVRDEIEKAFALRNASNNMGIRTEYHFLRHGAYLGALGALVTFLQS